jgi:hypothetical protein
VRQFDVGDFVYLQWQPNDTLDTSSNRTILRIKAIRPLGVLELQGADGCTIRDHSKDFAPQTWILPSSRRLGLLHLTIHVKYVKGHTMLIKCCFAIIIMVDTISSASSQSSLKFPLIFGTVHNVFLQHFDFYSNHAMFFSVQVWGGIRENFISPSSCALYIYVHAYLFD